MLQLEQKKTQKVQKAVEANVRSLCWVHRREQKRKAGVRWHEVLGTVKASLGRVGLAGVGGSLLKEYQG